MKQFIGGLIGASGLLLLGVAFSQNELMRGISLGLSAAVITFFGVALAQKPSRSSRTPAGEDLAAKENNRVVAQQLAGAGGMVGVVAGQWLQAYDRDSTVPIFGVRPYWTPTGPGGDPQLLSTVGLRGLDERLEYVRATSADDPLLPIMSADPQPEVREAVRLRLM